MTLPEAPTFFLNDVLWYSQSNPSIQTSPVSFVLLTVLVERVGMVAKKSGFFTTSMCNEGLRFRDFGCVESATHLTDRATILTEQVREAISTKVLFYGKQQCDQRNILFRMSFIPDLLSSLLVPASQCHKVEVTDHHTILRKPLSHKSTGLVQNILHPESVL